MKLELFTKKYFFETRWRNDIFDMVKKYTIFVQQIFKIQKKFLYMKKFKMLAFEDIRFSTETQGITEICSNQKIVYY